MSVVEKRLISTLVPAVYKEHKENETVEKLEKVLFQSQQM